MDAEIEMFLRVVEQGCEAVVRSLQGLAPESLHSAPGPGANSLASIAKHSLANAERNLLMTFAGETYEWRREEEFVADDETADSLCAAWKALATRLRASLELVPEARLTETLQHPRMGAVVGRAVLLQAARHVSEHAGESQLTRLLLDARQSPGSL
ncbi:MAG: DUF664 domain-containing protein [Tepidiformaceae bacterium]